MEISEDELYRLCEILKRHELTLYELRADVESLIATSRPWPSGVHPALERERKKKSPGDDDALQQRLRSIDAMLSRVRRNQEKS